MSVEFCALDCSMKGAKRSCAVRLRSSNRVAPTTSAMGCGHGEHGEPRMIERCREPVAVPMRELKTFGWLMEADEDLRFIILIILWR